MSQVDEAGAVAAATYFLELFGYVMVTGDLTDWKRFTAPSCQFCASVIDQVETVYGAGGYFTGGEVTFGEPVHIAFDPTLNVHGVEAKFSTALSTEYDAAGDVVQDFGSDNGYIVVEVILTQGGWLLQTGNVRDQAVQP